MTVLAVLTVLENTLPSSRWSYKIQDREATVTVLTVLAVSAVVAVSVVTATPLKLNPPRGNQSIYLHRSGPLLENDLDRRKNRYGRYGFASFSPAFPYLP